MACERSGAPTPQRHLPHRRCRSSTCGLPARQQEACLAHLAPALHVGSQKLDHLAQRALSDGFVPPVQEGSYDLQCPHTHAEFKLAAPRGRW